MNHSTSFFFFFLNHCQCLKCVTCLSQLAMYLIVISGLDQNIIDEKLGVKGQFFLKKIKIEVKSEKINLCLERDLNELTDSADLVFVGQCVLQPRGSDRKVCDSQASEIDKRPLFKDPSDMLPCMVLRGQRYSRDRVHEEPES